ncbi:hypothetical protein JW964_14430 [candidate division KSB1 bacterium]|nr:hypothetical protein [candidate division KSB1 bacterium]
MKKTGKYANRQLINNTSETILKIIKPGDVITQAGKSPWWQFWRLAVYWSIRFYQYKLFGRHANMRDVHAMIFLDEDNTFSVELPRATMKPLQEYCLTDFSIYRLQLKELNAHDIEVIKKTARNLVGQNYDLGQVLDIAINFLMGYEHQRKLKFFDLGARKKICSVGVRVLFEKLYQEKLKQPDAPDKKWLFETLNTEKWPQKIIQNYNGTDIEATSPAHFTNTDYFANEFKLIARFNGGKQVA